MPGFLDEMEQGLTQAGHKMDASKCLAAGKRVVCHHCGADTFETVFSLMGSAPPASFTVGWMNRKVTTLMCTKCGCIEHFAKEVERL